MRRACICLALVLWFAPHRSAGGSVSQQDQAKKAPPGKPQKLTNPLNDLLDEAQRDMDKSDFEAAIVPLQKVLAEKPDFAYAHFQLAYAYTALKRMEAARGEYERAISLDPKMAEAYLNLGLLFLDKQQYAAAVVPLRKTVELLPAQSRPRSLLGVALDRSGDEAGAAESFEAALRLDPNDYTAIVYLGWFSMHRNKPAEAEARFRRALEIQPDAPSALQGLAESLDAQKKPEAARRTVTIFRPSPRIPRRARGSSIFYSVSSNTTPRSRNSTRPMPGSRFPSTHFACGQIFRSRKTIWTMRSRRCGKPLLSLPTTRSCTAGSAGCSCRNAISPQPKKN